MFLHLVSSDEVSKPALCPETAELPVLRQRRPSSDAATSFMESLGLHVKTKDLAKGPGPGQGHSQHLMSPKGAGNSNEKNYNFYYVLL